MTASSTCCGFRKRAARAGKSLSGWNCSGIYWPMLTAAGIGADAKDRPLFRSTVRKTKQLTGNALTSKAICELVKRRLKAAKLPERLSPHSLSRDGDHRPAHPGRAARGCPVPRRAQQPANDAALRPAAEKGHAEHR